MDPPFSRNGGPPEVFKGESSEVLIREAIAGITRARAANKPVFQVIWFGSPHEPYSGLPQDLALYDDLPAKYTKKVGLTSNETGGPTRRPQGDCRKAPLRWSNAVAARPRVISSTSTSAM